MEQSYPLRSLAHLPTLERCTVVGKVMNRGSDFLMLGAGGATAKVMGLPQEMEGWVEVRGMANSGVFVAEEFTRIKTEVDLEAYMKLVHIYERTDLNLA